MNAYFYYFIVPFLIDMAAGIGLFAFPLYASSYLGLGPLKIGIIAGEMGLLYTAVNFFFEKIEKILKKEILIYLGPSLITAGYISLAFLKSTPQFIFALSISAVGHALFWPAFEAHLTLGKNENVKKKNLGYFNLGWLAGLTITGPLAGGFIYQALGSKTFLCAGIISLLGLGLNIVPVREKSYKSEPQLIKTETISGKLLYLIWFSNFVSFLAINSLRTFFPLLGVALKMTPVFIGFILFLPGVAQLAITIFLKNNPAWSYNLKTIIASQCLALAGMIILSIANAVLLLAAGLILSGIMLGITNYSSNLMSLSEESHSKKRIGIHEAVIGLAGIISGFLGGGMTDILGLRAPYLACLFVILMEIILELCIEKNGLDKAIKSLKSR